MRLRQSRSPFRFTSHSSSVTWSLVPSRYCFHRSVRSAGTSLPSSRTSLLRDLHSSRFASCDSSVQMPRYALTCSAPMSQR